jgi:hypothetical protein
MRTLLKIIFVSENRRGLHLGIKGRLLINNEYQTKHDKKWKQ